MLYDDMRRPWLRQSTAVSCLSLGWDVDHVLYRYFCTPYVGSKWQVYAVGMSQGLNVLCVFDMIDGLMTA